MNTEKLSISIPVQLSHFIEDYQATYACKSKSEVIQKALKMLQLRELEHCYRQAENEADDTLDTTAGEGLDDETW